MHNGNHTPPAPAAMEGAMRTLAFLRTSTASGMQGMFEPRTFKMDHTRNLLTVTVK